MNNTSPAAVSAKLRKAGFGIVATRNREGIRVSRGAFAGTVCVSVDLDREGEAERLADTLAEHLATWDGYTFTRYSCTFTVKKATTEPTAETHDLPLAWRFVVESYDSGYSPARRDWTDAEIFAFVAEHHVTGLRTFKL